MSVKKVVLAYSGGLDTSIIVRWLIETYGCEVVCFAADVGRRKSLTALWKKQLKPGHQNAILKTCRKSSPVISYLMP